MTIDMPTVEVSTVTLRNLVRASEQEIEHIEELASDEDCPDRTSRRLRQNKRAIEASVEAANGLLDGEGDEQ